MIKIVSESNDFLKNCNLTYAFCGGYALELFLNKTLRSHSDVDIIVFEEDKSLIIKYVSSRGWNIYEHKSEWIDNEKANSYLRLVRNPYGEEVLHLSGVWAIKPDCSLIKVEPKPGGSNIFNYEILNKEQQNFDFFEIVFNKQKDGCFVVDSFSSQNKNITRGMDKAILHRNGIPYLAPEIILFMISHPAYLKSDYHREKNVIDFNSTVPLLSTDSKDWLINALETAYPEGLERLEQLKNM
jgi:hypothetical protein